MKIITKNILKKIYKKREEKQGMLKKYDFGLLLVLGGGEFYSGSPAFVAMAAFRAGVDMVRIIAPKRAADIIASFSPNLAAYPLRGRYLKKEHLPFLFFMTKTAKIVSKNKTAIVIGSGMGRHEEIQKVILDYLSQTSIPAVIDADGIHALARNPEIIKGKNFLITPHTYEFFVLFKKKVFGLSVQEKIKIVQEQAKKFQTTILLKGAIDVISNGKEVRLNKTGNPFMTTGGMGDSLAGIAGAIMARGVDCFQAGCAAVYINGLAGEIASKKLGESTTAADLIEKIPDALRIVKI